MFEDKLNVVHNLAQTVWLYASSQSFNYCSSCIYNYYYEWNDVNLFSLKKKVWENTLFDQKNSCSLFFHGCVQKQIIYLECVGRHIMLDEKANNLIQLNACFLQSLKRYVVDVIRTNCKSIIKIDIGPFRTIHS
jgi:hypothetical protein